MKIAESKEDGSKERKGQTGSSRDATSAESGGSADAGKQPSATFSNRFDRIFEEELGCPGGAAPTGELKRKSGQWLTLCY